ncbi:ATP-binding protein [Oricola cellulosilytica]|uniref:histidine kinase n=1 Tax=Oricola cellulosilytica TaxID=1429082 RepID=A0A4R0PA54_9HYPH|nr:ATP-binding protein [Oricola cellulosilytica]TCD14131.1 histidine kinase [Oricola cellulosilytica]
MNLRLDSLAVRVVLLSSLWTVAAIAFLGWLLIGLYRSDSERGFENLQQAQLYNLVGAISVDDAGELTGFPDFGSTSFLQPLSGWYWRVEPIENVEGPPLASPSLSGETLEGPPLSELGFDEQFQRVWFAEGPGGVNIRVLETEIELGEGRIARFQLAGNQDEFEFAIRDFARRVGLILLAFGAGVVLINVGILLLGLRPLDRARRALAEIRSGAATSLKGRFPREIQPLVDEMNALIDNNRRIVERSRTQVGNLAHSLKTPLSVLLNEAGAKKSPSRTIVAEQARAMDFQVQHYLKRARIAAQRESIVFRTDARPVLEKLIGVMRKLNPEKSVELETTRAMPVFMGEKEDLEEIAGNLMENAAKWSRGRIDVSLDHFADDAGKTWLKLAVEDDGPGIPARERDTALKRGKRLDESVPGTGLGLAIVAETASAYGGTIELGESRAGGLRAEVILPAASH